MKILNKPNNDALNIKSQAHELIDHLPDTATWDDVLCEIIERQAIEKGITASNDNRVIDSDELRSRYFPS